MDKFIENGKVVDTQITRNGNAVELVEAYCLRCVAPTPFIEKPEIWSSSKVRYTFEARLV